MALDRLKLYKSSLNETQFWEKITFLIQEHSNAGLKGYVKKFNYHRKEKIFGKIEGDKFWIWKQGFFSGSIFYPIFHGQILDRKGKLHLEMNSKPNSLGGLFFILASLVLGIFIAIWLLFFQEYNSTTEKIIYLAIASIIFIISQFIPNITYTLSKRSFRQFLEKELKLKRTN
jgi:hypothetical protein